MTHGLEKRIQEALDRGKPKPAPKWYQLPSLGIVGSMRMDSLGRIFWNLLKLVLMLGFIGLCLWGMAGLAQWVWNTLAPVTKLPLINIWQALAVCFVIWWLRSIFSGDKEK